MQIRDLAQPFIRHIMGNGTNTNFWFDTWHPLGPLYKQLIGNLLYSFACKPNASVSGIKVDGKWRWPVGRKETAELRRLKEAIPACFEPLVGFEDQIVWEKCLSGVFQTKTAMKLLSGARKKMTWAKLVWGKGFVPRSAFILLLLCKKRFDRLVV